MGRDIAPTYDIPDFVVGQTYTVSYRVGGLSDPDNNIYVLSCFLAIETNNNVIAPYVKYKADDTVNACISSGAETTIDVVSGDWISIVFTVPASGTNKGNIYINGIDTGLTQNVYNDYWVRVVARRPFQERRNAYTGYSSRVELYYGDMHNQYVL